MTTIKLIFILLVISLFSGCASQSFSEGGLKESYKPVAINNVDKSDAALIKAATGLSIWKIDGERQVNGFKVLFKGGYDSVLLSEGFHTISGTMGRDVNIGRTYYKKGHEYLIDYLKVMNGRSGKIYYWVKDMTDGKVVYGKEKNKSEFKK